MEGRESDNRVEPIEFSESALLNQAIFYPGAACPGTFQALQLLKKHDLELRGPHGRVMKDSEIYIQRVVSQSMFDHDGINEIGSIMFKKPVMVGELLMKFEMVLQVRWQVRP